MTRITAWFAPALIFGLAAVGGYSTAAAQNNSGTPGEAKQSEQPASTGSTASGQGQPSSQPQSTGQSQSSGGAGTSTPSGQPGSTSTGNSSSNNQPAGTGNNQPQGQAQSNQPNQQPQAGQPNARTNQPAAGQNAPRQNNAGGQPNRDNSSRDNQRNNADVNIGVGIQFGAATGRGLTVTNVDRNSFFFTSGIRQGDVIISVGGRPFRTHDEFIEFVRVRRGERIPVIVLRNGREETIYVVYEQAPDMQIDVGNQANLLGVVFDSQNQNAAIVRDVAPGSPAATVGIQPGDEIVAVGGRRLAGYQNAIQTVGSLRAGEQIEVEYRKLQKVQIVLGANVPHTAAAAGQVRVDQNVQPTNFQQDVQVQQNQTPTPPAQPGGATQKSGNQNQPRTIIPRIRN